MRMLFVMADDNIPQEEFLKQISQNFSKKKQNHFPHEPLGNSQLSSTPRKTTNLNKRARKLLRKTSSSDEGQNGDDDKKKRKISIRQRNEKLKVSVVHPPKRKKQCEILEDYFVKDDREGNISSKETGKERSGRESLATDFNDSDILVTKKTKIVCRGVDDGENRGETKQFDTIESSVLGSLSACGKKTVQSKTLAREKMTRDFDCNPNLQTLDSLVERNAEIQFKDCMGNKDDELQNFPNSHRAIFKDCLKETESERKKPKLNLKTGRKCKADEKVKVEKQKNWDGHGVHGCRLREETQVTEKSDTNGESSDDDNKGSETGKSAWDGESFIHLRNLFSHDKNMTLSESDSDGNMACDDGDPCQGCPAESLFSSRISVGKKPSSGFPMPIPIPDWIYVAVDCEMVGIGPKGKKSALARCSIVDYDGDLLYDKYVKPKETITDYRTPWSGIKPKHMIQAIPLEVALGEIKACLSNKIVIGHAVYHDFRVLDLKPEYYFVRDTAQCKQLVTMADLQGRGNSLKKLTQALLDRHIQVGRQGHCSVEDARATLDLFKLVRKTWEPELYSKWIKKEPTLASKMDQMIEDAKKSSGKNFEDFLHDKFWPCHVIE